ncbi:MAG: tRNA (guanosine(37)-N1)-methyltransferase TrmD, partial [Halobacteria archaeon]|nr:tRNA (guanosine(37)-N1)-methyltransferase TrmD [Halobacteria archaeon]
MRIDVVTLFPQMFQVLTDYGITGRAVNRGILEMTTWNPRDYAPDRHQTVDDRPYGGGPGMVMMVQPMRDAIREARAMADGRTRVIYLSPQGRKLDQHGLTELAKQPNLVLVCGRYEGVDERVIAAEVD